ncbi:hypothetical protein HRI_003170800 [Hibiscus trionum]|uniref:Malic enzyme N-terminal domain-containing protein n=1 Tax=Hibiscus trionum TaxID=183268 RepID=A0A9W7ME85_HIBTR|nr:hypothetical protein HRI_003170800 [Hibiscus trionum]
MCTFRGSFPKYQDVVGKQKMSDPYSVQIYGEKVVIHFEDFANHNAFELLARYSCSHLVFKDDIQVRFSLIHGRVPRLWCCLGLLQH